MPDSESFDAFYARTVGNITSQMHALAGADSAADHAIREAYARAYQQWYEVASYPDTEGWLLAIAKEAYQRRRPMAAAPVRDPARPGHDPLSMPGMFRPTPVRDASAGTGDTTLAPPAATPPEAVGRDWFTPAAASPDDAEGAAAGWTRPAQGISGLFGGRSGTPSSATATAQAPGDNQAVTGPPAEPTHPWRPGPLAGSAAGRRRPSVTVLALVVVLALAAASGIAYLLTGNPAGQAAHHGATAAHRKPVVQMLAAGRTGTSSAIPWKIVGPGWTLAEVSSAPAGTGLSATGGSVTTYLVDPRGGKYQIQTSAGPAPVLLAWSGNGQNALFAAQPGPSGTNVTYELLSLTTGNMSALQLPSGVTAVGFTRPDGLNILAVSQSANAFQLERFNLQGAYQATIGSLPRKPSMLSWQVYCGRSCGALSSPDGDFAVWGVTGDQMQLLSNAGGAVIRRLVVPDSGSPPSCVPLTWWNSNTVLAACSVTGNPAESRLWLVPANGDNPTPLTSPSGIAEGSYVVTGAWQGPGGVYVTETNTRQCAGAASGPGGLAVATVGGGSLQHIGVRGTTNNHTSVVAAVDGQLLLLAQTSCPGTSSLLWLNPSTGATQVLLSPPTSEAGVVSAVPYGNGPTAIAGG